MNALAEALLAAQRQAVTTLSKWYVTSGEDGDYRAEKFEHDLNAIGCTDKIEQGQLLSALDVLREHGATTANGATAKPPPESEPASEAQWKLLRRLADERKTMAPDGPLTKAQASAAINALKAGTYNADDYTAPF